MFGLDAPRFSRNGAEWFELLRWLRATGTLLLTDEGVYDACSGDDSFVLGLHGTLSVANRGADGTLSVAELYRIKARMDKGKLNKARRGELYHAAPDAHVQEAIGLVFAKFRELGTARQVAKALRAESEHAERFRQRLAAHRSRLQPLEVHLPFAFGPKSADPV